MYQSWISSRLTYPKINEVLCSLTDIRLENYRENGIVFEFVLYSTAIDHQVEITIIGVSRHLDSDCVKHHMQDLLPHLFVSTDKTDTDLWNFDDVLVCVFTLLLIFLNLQLQFFDIVLKAKD